jgi:hypothetical protein
MCIARTSRGTWPRDCAASTRKETFFARQTAPISAMGCSVPATLLAWTIATRAVSLVIAAATSLGLTRPVSGSPSRMVQVTRPPVPLIASPSAASALNGRRTEL